MIPVGADRRGQTADYKLYAANGTAIDKYGERLVELNLGLRRSCVWNFIVTDIKYPIIGADFLSHYSLLPDLRNKRLVDGRTHLKATRTVTAVDYQSVTTCGKEEFATILADYLGITQPIMRRTSSIQSHSTHVIETNGAPATVTARCLPPDKPFLKNYYVRAK